MPRKSLIDQLKIGDKVIAYSVGGKDSPAIAKQIAQEHNGVVLTPRQIEHHLKRNTALISEKKAVVVSNSVEFTVDSIRKAVGEASREARQMYESYKDDPKAGWAWFKHYLDTLDRVAKMVGAFQPDSQVNVQINVAAIPLADQLREHETYFQSLEKSAVGQSFHGGRGETTPLNSTNGEKKKDAPLNP